MKYLMALFVLSLALQPVNLQACAMGGNQEISHLAAMHEGITPDCCDPDPLEPTENCGLAAHCAFLSFGFLVIPAAAADFIPLPKRHFDVFDAAHHTGPPIEPLFRPPIA